MGSTHLLLLRFGVQTHQHHTGRRAELYSNYQRSLVQERMDFKNKTGMQRSLVIYVKVYCYGIIVTFILINWCKIILLESKKTRIFTFYMSACGGWSKPTHTSNGKFGEPIKSNRYVLVCHVTFAWHAHGPIFTSRGRGFSFAFGLSKKGHGKLIKHTAGRAKTPDLARSLFFICADEAARPR